VTQRAAAPALCEPPLSSTRARPVHRPAPLVQRVAQRADH
jgi:hypothetical protein